LQKRKCNKTAHLQKRMQKELTGKVL